MTTIHGPQWYTPSQVPPSRYPIRLQFSRKYSYLTLSLSILAGVPCWAAPCNNPPLALSAKPSSKFCIAFTLDRDGKVAIDPALSQFKDNGT
jgi:hypothetical protein